MTAGVRRLRHQSNQKQCACEYRKLSTRVTYNRRAGEPNRTLDADLLEVRVTLSNFRDVPLINECHRPERIFQLT